MEINECIEIYKMVLVYVLPFILITNIVNMLLNMILSAAFGGKLNLSFR